MGHGWATMLGSRISHNRRNRILQMPLSLTSFGGAPFGRVWHLDWSVRIVGHQWPACAVAAEGTTLLLSKMIRAYYGFRYHRIRRTIWLGSAVRLAPINFCLSAQGHGITDPATVPPSTV
jgi:hypothetical protein